MSVVNKMLRDLDNRGYDQNGGVKNVNYVAPQSSKGLHAIIGCLSMVCVAVASYSVYLVNQPTTDAPVQVVPKVVDVERGDQYAEQENAVTNNNTVMQASVNSLSESVESQGTNKAITKSEATFANGRNTHQNAPTVVAKTIPNPDISPLVNLASPVRTITQNVNFQDDAVSAAQIKVSPSGGARTQLSALRAKAHMATQQNDNVLAVKLLRSILVLDPLEMNSRKKLAALLFSTDQFSEAQKVLSQGISQTPADSSMRLMLSRLFFKLDDNESAFKVLSDHPYNSLANDDLVSFRAALAEKIGQYGNAQKDYQLLVQRNPRDAKWWLGLGVSQDKQRLNKQAISSYQQAQSLNQLSQKVNSFMTTRIQLLTRSS